ncbi:MAG TPA: hypothetical protein DD429_12220 [Clostridiaceae bacterium]|nr:hypothetical protein [Clostridiaceae bacterium]
MKTDQRLPYDAMANADWTWRLPKMKKYSIAIVLISCIIVVMISSMAAYSYFTSKAMSNGNFLSTGTMSIRCPGAIEAEDIASLNNMYPDSEETAYLKVENDGTLDFDYRMSIEDKNLCGNPLFDGEVPIQLKVEKNDTPISEYTDLNKLGYLNLGSIAKGGFDRLKFYFRLPEDAGNECQGESAKISFLFEAKQQSAPFAAGEEQIPKSGQILYVGDKEEYKTIQSAIEDADDNATIMVSPKRYDENIVINKPINLIGRYDTHKAYEQDENNIDDLWGGEPEIWPPGGCAIMLSKGVSNVLIKGFRIKDAKGAGIASEGDLKNVVIENNIFVGSKSSCIYFPGINTENVTIKYNRFICPQDADKPAIDMGTADLKHNANNNMVIYGNVIEGSKTGEMESGIMLVGSKDSYISNNLFYNIKFPLQAMGSENIVCSYNTVKDCFYGLQFISAEGYSMDDIKIKYNRFEKVRSRALSIKKSTDSGAGSIGNILIEKNTLNLELTASTPNEFVPIHIFFDDRKDHGPIEIKKNIIKLEGKLDKYKYVYALKLLGNLNIAYIQSNVFDASAAEDGKKPDCAICIGDNEAAVPKTAEVILEDNVFKGFAEDISYTRK